MKSNIEKLPRLTMKVIYFSEARIGRIFYNERMICDTIERPDNKNASDNPKTKINESSCIPEGVYLCDYTLSPRLGKKTFEIKEVKGRSGIRIHSANLSEQLLGCIAPATQIVRNVRGEDGKLYAFWASQSRKALERLEKFVLEELKTNQFVLEIVAGDKAIIKF